MPRLRGQHTEEEWAEIRRAAPRRRYVAWAKRRSTGEDPGPIDAEAVAAYREYQREWSRKRGVKPFQPRLIDYHGELISLSEAARRAGLNAPTLHRRIFQLEWPKERWYEPSRDANRKPRRRKTQQAQQTSQEATTS